MMSMNNKEPKQVSQERNIPIDLLETEIFPRLPAESLLRFKIVSKQWLAIISNPQFKKLHLHRSSSSQCGTFLVESSNDSLYFLNHANHGTKSQDPVIHRDLNPYHGPRSRRTNLVDSSNGLICLVTNTETLCFLNPATGVCREVICPKKCFQFYVGCLLAFGYSTPSDEYKLLYVDRLSHLPKAHVYTLRSSDDLHNWRDLSVDDALRPYQFNFQIVGNIINEKAHWLVRKKRTYGSGHCFLAFDLTSETFNEIWLPQLCGENQDIISTMFKDVPRGYFFIAGIVQKLCLFYECKNNLDIWMKMRYGVSESWSRIYNFDIGPNSFSAVGMCCNSCKITREEGKLFFVVLNAKFLLVKDLNARQLQCLEVFDIGCVVKSIRRHVNSFVSPFLC
ncbi:F-box/kelch-repeat protein At3g06240-like [Silene latifolia]|uniref:F-box/kelch-repeat protein At3g06240-like n=1 Tax=Silene latifolia TaxID=37657 RepID=UPI003D7800BF